MEESDTIRFQPGDSVRIRDDNPDHHHRTPWFVKGKTGRIADICGTFRNPETRAYGGTGLPKQPVYRVEFNQSDLWENHTNKPLDKILIDIYQNWLEPI